MSKNREPGFYFCKLFKDTLFEPAYYSQQNTWHFTMTDMSTRYFDHDLFEIDERLIVREEPSK